MEVAAWLKESKVVPRAFIDDVVPDMIKLDDYKPQETDELLLCVADPKGREQIFNTIIARFPKVPFHGMFMGKRAHTASYGTGCIVCPNALLSNKAQLADFVIVNVYTSIGHDCKVGNFTTFSSHCDITGNVTIGERCFFGSGARVLPGVKIGNDCTIGAGAIVVKDVPDGKTMYAQPARML